MQTPGRSTRMLALTTAYTRLNEAAFNPYLTTRERQQFVDSTFAVIAAVLDEEYMQGYRDGGDCAVTIVKSVVSERERF